MHYLVHTSGEIVNRQTKAYVVKASSKEEAQEIARNNFCEEFWVADEYIYTKPYKRNMRMIFAIVFMLIPILLSFVGWKNGHSTISIMPSYISCLYAVLLYAAFIVRFKGIHRAFETWWDVLLCVLIVLLLSSFIQTLLVTKNINVLGMNGISIDTSMVVFIAIILSWCGLKLVSTICMVGVGLLAMFNIMGLSNAMGPIWGPMYVICAFVGVLFYASVEPAIVEALPYIRSSIRSGIGYVKQDVMFAGNTVKNIKEKYDDIQKNNESKGK